jgi:F0F1-type ATP synthase membrane subunit b/b'
MGFLLSCLMVAGVAFASPGSDKPHGDDHGEAHSEDHGEGHDDDSHHAYQYSADDDGDGTANWMDPTNGDEPNDHYVLGSIGFHLLNFLIFVSIIVYVARRPVGDLLRERARGIRKELVDTARERDEAKERYAELAKRLDAVADEVDAMKAEAEVEAANEERRLIEAAHAEAVRIEETTERNIRDEVARARVSLRNEAVGIAVELAQGLIQKSVTVDDQRRLAKDFLASVEADGGVANG